MPELIRERTPNFNQHKPSRREVSYKDRAIQFIDTVPDYGNLFDRDDMRQSRDHRDMLFRDTCESLIILLRAFGDLDKEQQMAIVERIQTIFNSVNHISEKTAQAQAQNILKLVEVHIPKELRPSRTWNLNLPSEKTFH